METSDTQFASEKLKQLQEEFRVDILADWGAGSDGSWQSGCWVQEELDRLHRTNCLPTQMAGIIISTGAIHPSAQARRRMLPSHKRTQIPGS